MKEQKMPLGLYIHIPFCAQKCAYCDFYSLPHAEGKMDEYVRAVSAHLAEVAPRAAQHIVDTVYFGGGTPSYLGPKRLKALLSSVQKHYVLSKDAEITLEANPDSAGDWRALRTLRRAGFNRISLGMQSSIEGELRAVGRIHTFEQVRAAVDAARKAKFKNVSLDLIYGLPEQTMESFSASLRAAVALEPEHISCYGLKLEEGTPLYTARNTFSAADDDLQADMYLFAVSFLQEAGFAQYEISNFARHGFESRHNLKYWNAEEYLGLGASAHSFLGGKRFFYPRDRDAFLRGEGPIQDGEGGSFEEYAMLRMRLADGLIESLARQRYGCGIPPYMRESARRMEQYGLTSQDEDGIRLTRKGFLLSNTVIAELLYPAGGTAG